MLERDFIWSILYHSDAPSFKGLLSDGFANMCRHRCESLSLVEIVLIDGLRVRCECGERANVKLKGMRSLRNGSIIEIKKSRWNDGLFMMMITSIMMLAGVMFVSSSLYVEYQLRTIF